MSEFTDELREVRKAAISVKKREFEEKAGGISRAEIIENFLKSQLRDLAERGVRSKLTLPIRAIDFCEKRFSRLTPRSKLRGDAEIARTCCEKLGLKYRVTIYKKPKEIVSRVFDTPVCTITLWGLITIWW